MSISHKYQTWLKQRFPLIQEKQLKQRDILIFVYQYGILYCCLMALTFIAGVNYANNLILGFCFLISSVFFLSFYLTFKQLHGLTVEIVLPEVGQAQQILPIELILKQNLKTPRYLYIEYQQQVQRVLLSEQQQKIILYDTPPQRGEFYLFPIKLYSVYPFGLVRTWTYFYCSEVIWIAPQITKLQQENKIQQQDFTPDVDEFRELRPFQQGDNYHAVSWKHVALGQGTFIKVFEQLKDQQHIHIIYEQMPSASHEEKLSLMMGLIEQCHQQQFAYSVQLPQQQLTYSSGQQHYIQAKKLLAQA